MANKINLGLVTDFRFVPMVLSMFLVAMTMTGSVVVQAQVHPREGVVSQREEEKPRGHRFFDRNNLIGFGVMFTARGLDVHSTCRFLRRGYREAVFPSQRCGTIAAGAFSASGMVVGVSYWFHRKGHHKVERWLPRIAAISGGIAATWNYSIP